MSRLSAFLIVLLVAGLGCGDDDPAPSAPQTGACCLGVECSVTTEADCQGDWLGAGTACDPNPCLAHDIEMVLVPGGTFVMGDGDTLGYCGMGEHTVTLRRSFYLGQAEVTNQEYLEALQWAYDQGHVLATTSEVRDSLDGSTELLLALDDEHCEIQFDGAGTFYLRESPDSDAQDAYPGGYDPANHPVKEVSWHGAVRYCDWLSLQAGLPRAYDLVESPAWGDWVCNGGDPYGAAGYRLPTDAEWEYAAQFDDEWIYPWGDEEPHCGRANFWNSRQGSQCVGWTSSVGSSPAAPAALGLRDMAGNVWEWCNDWWVCDLERASVSDPTGPDSGARRVLRGGSWHSIGTNLRCAGRYGIDPSSSEYGVGFRAAKTTAP